MAQLSPAGVNIAIVVVGALLYAFIWFATRDLSRLAKILARLAPLGLIIPVLLYLSMAAAPKRDAMAPRPAPAPPVESAEVKPPKTAARNGSTDTAEAERRANEEARRQEEQRRVAEAEAQRRAAEEAQRKSAQAEQKAEAPPSPVPPPPAPAQEPERKAEPAPPPPAATAPPVVTRAPLPVAKSAPKAAELPTDQAPRPQVPPPGVPAAPQTDWDIVPVFYGTDRVRKDEPKRPTYTSDRARKLELGRALVTVPKSHQVPNIERPFAIRIPYFNITIYEQAEDPKQHFTVRELKVLSREEFIALVRSRVGGGTAFKDQAVVFVHGYNTGFDYALFRAAQMAYDLKFDGATFMYSWPSSGGLTSYNRDRESSEQAEPYLRDFIELAVKESGAKSVSVIAHSMGNMPLLRVLLALGPSLPPGVRLNQVILAAPDVDRNLFENLAANIKQYGRGITLYCSSNDRAMAAARQVAGGIPRAGDVPVEGPVVITGIDTIDVSQASTDYLALNHSSYAEKGALLEDIAKLLQTGERPPDKRFPNLQRVNTPNGDFWRYLLAR